MNTQKYIIASVGAAVWLFAYGFVVYGLLLADYFAGVTPAALMRPEDQQLIMFIGLGCLIQGLGLGYIFTKNYEAKGVGEGVRFGVLIAIFVIGLYTLMYGIQPYTLQGLLSSMAVDGIMYIGAGAVLALLYKK